MKWTAPWERHFPAFKIFGNLYFVGTEDASTHIIDTGDGLIMLDSGYQHTLYKVIDGMYTLGLNPHHLKYILHTHGHIDHFGATRALVELTGAKTVIGEADRLYATGELDLSYAKELGMEFNEVFTPDILVNDGDELTLGNTEITCYKTPGHTPGAMTYMFNVSDEKESFKAALHGGMGINTMCREFLDKYNLSYDCRQNFFDAMDRLSEEKVDIFLGNHMQHNDTPGKYEKLMAGYEKAFINPSEWGPYCMSAKENLKNLIERENKR